MAGFEQDKLDAMIKKARPEDVGMPGFEQWAESHAEAIAALKAQSRFGAYRPRTVWRMVQVAALLAVVIGLGFVGGRFSVDSHVDVDQLRTDLEMSLKSSLEASLVANGTQLKSDILTLLHQDLSVLTTQTLEASQVMTDQRLTELIRLIETVRQQDRKQIVTALEQIEQDRLRDKIQINQGFKTLVAYTTDNKKTIELN
ncbi:MAG: hypothetical protein HQ515_10665 [Phycisphaeraceae bacterium]|nr:hypothetical protein [Phycisphaeraceae bacterium]